MKKVKKGKVAVFTCGLDIAQTETKGTVLLKSAEEMLNFTRGEEKQLEKVRPFPLSTSPPPLIPPTHPLTHPLQIFQEIADSGVKVIIAGSSVGELALHYLNRLNIAVLKVLSKFDLRRLCRVVNATPLARMGAPTPEEAGFVDVFECTEIGGDRVTVLRQLDPSDPADSSSLSLSSSSSDPASTLSSPSSASSPARSEKTRTATIVLRGATQNRLDDLERAIDDGVNVIKALLKDARLVPGAGATELALARRVDAYGGGLRGLAQHAVKRWAQALEVVPRTLAENALGGAEGNEVVSRLWAKHEGPGGEVYGVDVEVSVRLAVVASFPFDMSRLDGRFADEHMSQAETDGTLSATEHQILDSLAAKQWAIKLATEAATSVLSVDSIIMSRPAGGPKIPQQAGNWDED